MMDVMMMRTKAVIMKGESNGEEKSYKEEMMDTPPIVMTMMLRMVISVTKRELMKVMVVAVPVI